MENFIFCAVLDITGFIRSCQCLSYKIRILNFLKNSQKNTSNGVHFSTVAGEPTLSKVVDLQPVTLPRKGLNCSDFHTIFWNVFRAIILKNTSKVFFLEILRNNFFAGYNMAQYIQYKSPQLIEMMFRKFFDPIFQTVGKALVLA